MKDFNYYNPSRIVFHKELAKALDEAKNFLCVSKAMIMTDPGLASLPVFQHLLSSMNAIGFPYEIYANVKPNPIDTLVTEASEALICSDADVVIGFGGGSSIDTAKATAVLKTNGGTLKDYYGMNTVPLRPLPVITIPTTAGSGAEITQVISIIDTQEMTKAQIGSPLCIPPVAILCPAVFKDTPSSVSSIAAFDALTHCLEGYTNAKANPVTEALSLHAFGILYPAIRDFSDCPNDEELASNMILGSNMAAMTISNIGTGNCHNIARAIGGHFDIPHGLSLSILLPHILNFNLDVCEKKYADCARIAKITNKSMNDRESAQALILEVQKLRHSLGMPDNFKELGMTTDQESMDSIIKNAMKSHTSTVSKGAAPKYADADAIYRLIMAAYEGQKITF